MTIKDAAVRAQVREVALDGIAIHLSRAGRVERLLELFADDRWLRRQLSQKQQRWDTYQAAIELAWNALETELAQPTGRLSDDAVTAAVRLAVVRSSITMADNIPLDLVLGAARTGLWDAADALSTIGRYPSTSQRALGMMRLCETVGPNTTAGMQAQTGLAELARLPPDEVPARTLLLGLHRLAPALRERVVQSLEGTAGILTTVANVYLDDVPTWMMRVEVLLPAELLMVLNEIPESRSPVLISRFADALISQISRTSARDQAVEKPGFGHSAVDRDQGGEPDEWRGLKDLQFSEYIYHQLSPEEVRRSSLEALGALADHLESHADPQSFLTRMADILRTIEGVDAWRIGEHYRAAARDIGITWEHGLEEPSTESQKAEEQQVTDDPNRSRRALMHEIMRRRDRSVIKPQDIGFGPNLEELTERWLTLALPPDASSQRPSGGQISHSNPSDDTGGSENEDELGEMPEELQRLTKPSFLAAFAVVNSMPDDAIIGVAEEMCSPKDLQGQLFMLSLPNQLPQLPAPELAAARSKVKIGLLRAALAHGFRERTLSSAWDGVTPEDLHGLDFDPILDFVLSLPAEVPRNIATWLQSPTASYEPVHLSTVPRYTALALALPYLDEVQVDRCFGDVLTLKDPAVARIGMELLAPQLNGEQIARALTALDVAPDTEQQARLLAELAASLEPGDPNHPPIQALSRQTAEDIRSGQAFVRAMLGRSYDPSDEEKEPVEAGSLAEPTILAGLAEMDSNNRLDAVIEAIKLTAGKLPAEFVELALELSTENMANVYSWRGIALVGMADRLPEEMVGPAWLAVQELPTRLSLGDGQIWGRHWNYEYPQAAAMHALAGRLNASQAREAFEVVKEFPWAPSEEILEILAAQASPDLACDIFDYWQERHRLYQALPDGGDVPFALENTFVVEPLAAFKARRQAKFADLIAATADRLDRERLDKAVRYALESKNAGPRAWLPGRLLSLVDREQSSLMLSSAIVAVLELCDSDTAFLDVLAELMPHIEEERARRALPLQEFVHEHFPDYSGAMTLPEELLSLLSPFDLETYRRLMGVDVFQELAESRERPNRDEMRQSMMKAVLLPFYSEHFEKIISYALTRTPLEVRLGGMEAMRKILSPASHEQVVLHTLRELVSSSMNRQDRFRGFGALAPYLGEEMQQELVDSALMRKGVLSVDDEIRGYMFFSFVLNDLSTEWNSADERHKLEMLAEARIHHSSARRVFAELQSERSQLFEQIVDDLAPAVLEQTVEDALRLPEIDRAAVMGALLPSASPAVRGRLVKALFDFHSAFGGFWSLYCCREELAHTESREMLQGDGRELADLAWATAMRFREPLSRIGCLIALVDYADLETRNQWWRWAVEQVDALSDRQARDALNVLARFEDTPGLRSTILAKLHQLSTSASDEANYTSFASLGRLGVSLNDANGTHLVDLRALTIRRLRELSSLDRPRLLQILIDDIPAIAALCTPEDISAIADHLHDVCNIWQWRPVRQPDASGGREHA